MTNERAAEIAAAVRRALMNSLVAELEGRIASLGGLMPVRRADAEERALNLILQHLALLGRETVATLTPVGVLNRVTEFAVLWKLEKERVIKLVPIREEVDERLN